MSGPDRLAGSSWELCSTAPGVAADPAGLAGLAVTWRPAIVPGTAAGALRDAGVDFRAIEFDSCDWWFRTSFDVPRGRHLLTFAGLATVADVWLDGAHLLHSENMFRGFELEVDLSGRHELVIRFAALDALLARRRPRPRWKVRRLRSQNLRWVRTTLLGRMIGWPATSAPVGPWRAVTLHPVAGPRVVRRHLRADPDGVLGVEVEFDRPPTTVSVVVEGRREALLGSDTVFTGNITVVDVEPWWPWTHGGQRLYQVSLDVDGESVELARVGFRAVVVDRRDGGFALSVNGVGIFFRGACWTPLDPDGLVDDETAVRAALEQVRAAGFNLVRIGGETVYCDPTFVRLCDELGVMIWQDAMFAFADVPDDADLLDSIERELSEQLGALPGHPSVAVISGGSEIEQQAAMAGTDRERWTTGLFAETMPALVERLLPGTPFVSSSPTGGALPIEPGTGVAHYYGVGAYLRPPEDARRANVRFAAECLAFANPPERHTVDEAFGGAAGAGHHPRWKEAVYRDAGAAWDFEDVRDHYVRTLFGVEPSSVRYADPERALDLGRAAVAELVTSTLSEWRRAESSCHGAVIFHYRDLRVGAGLGLVDALGRPKSPWYAAARVLAPIAVTFTDEGLNGLVAHLYNDPPAPVRVTLDVALVADGEVVAERAQREVDLAGHASHTVALNELFDGFRDLTYAYRFGPVAYDVVVLSLRMHGQLISRQCYLPGGGLRPREPDLGLAATATPISTNPDWSLTVSTRRVAQWVSVDVAGFVSSDSWFHLAPGESRTVILRPDGVLTRPRGRVHALNGSAAVPIALVPAPGDAPTHPADDRPDDSFAR